MTPQAVRRNRFGRATEAALSALPPVMRWLCVANFLTIYLFAQCSQPASSSYTSGVYTLSSSTCITATTMISGSASVVLESTTSIGLEPGFDAAAGTATTTFHAFIGTPVSITTTLLPSAVVSTSYSQTLSATGGAPPYGNWAVTSGSLPPGLSLNISSGVVSGTPTTSTGSPFSFSVTVTDSAGATSQPGNLSIAICPVCYTDFTLSTPSPSSQSVAQGYTSGRYAISAAALSGYTGIIGFAVTSGLPSGATASFSPSSVSNSGTPVLTIATGTSTPAGTSTLTITATSGGWTHTTTTSLTIAAPPSITSLTPTSGTSGTQVTVSGSGFGASRGTGSIWLGSTLGIVVSWSDTQIVATVASSATSGSARVGQNGAWSNAVAFNIATATISGISPSSGLPGTQVAITGSGFGPTQGTGQVWIGTANAVVQSWSDTQLVALVASGSLSGQAQVLQNGVYSNAVVFGVNTPHITSLTPSSGTSGTSVTITGTGFGTSQGSGTVQLGSVAGLVNTWSDTQIGATVASSALTGIVRIQQNGIFSNASSFTVSGGSSVMLAPNLLNLVAGDTHAIQALNSSGQPVTGLTWTSSSSSVVSLSGSDPPILTALIAGHVTITAGTATADVTVSSDALPLGTVGWSMPDNGTDIYSLIPAVPSTSGVADVFAVQNDGTILAITSDGTVAWRSTENVGGTQSIADFQGGLVLVDYINGTVVKLDGLTGQPIATYTSAYGVGSAAVHPDGTVFVSEGHDSNNYVTGIDSATGSQKFSIQVGTWESFPTAPMIAGDGYAYIAYVTAPNDRSHLVTNLLRVDSSGAADVLHIYDSTLSGPADILFSGVGNIIASGDTGAFFAGEIINGTQVTPIAVTTSGTGVSVVNSSYPDVPPGWEGYGWSPVLQLQDGAFAGTIYSGSDLRMVVYDSNNNLRWSVPNDTPKIATADGGVVAQSGIIYDQNGNATGQSPPYIQSWIRNQYQTTPVAQIAYPPFGQATPPYWSFAQANQSGNSTSPLCHDDRDKLVAEYGARTIRDVGGTRVNGVYPRFIPTCFDFTNQAHSQNYTFQDMNPSALEYGYALVRNPLVVPAANQVGLEYWIQLIAATPFPHINSTYRSPVRDVIVAGPNYPNGRHQFGDAVDLASTTANWQDIHDKASQAGAGFVESSADQCHYSCVHADWRSTRGDYRH